MSALMLVRTLSLKHPDDDGTTRVEVHDLAGGEADTRTPIMVQFLDDAGQISSTVALRWSEWDELRDHVEYCATMMKPEPVEITGRSEWVTCDVGPGLVPYEPLPCVLERGHNQSGPGAVEFHIDRRGRRW